MELTIQALEKLAPEDLANAINDLIKNDFSKLVQLLYRIDVSEAKLKYILQAHPNEDAGKLIAALGKCNNFDMTLMFMDSKEKKDLVNII
jgi:hypothetical protein